MPTKKNNILKFTQYSKTNQRPFVIYADTEAVLIKEEVKKFNKIKNLDEIV